MLRKPACASVPDSAGAPDPAKAAFCRFVLSLVQTHSPRSREGPAEVEAHDGHPVEHGDTEIVDGIAQQLAGQGENLDQEFAFTVGGSRFCPTAATTYRAHSRLRASFLTERSSRNLSYSNFCWVMCRQGFSIAIWLLQGFTKR